jgi:hypothetical protein
VLQPLGDFREKLVFVRGLYHEEARKGNIHSSQTGNMLSGAPIASGGEIRSGTSMDQLLEFARENQKNDAAGQFSLFDLPQALKIDYVLF